MISKNNDQKTNLNRKKKFEKLKKVVVLGAKSILIKENLIILLIDPVYIIIKFQNCIQNCIQNFKFWQLHLQVDTYLLYFYIPVDASLTTHHPNTFTCFAIILIFFSGIFNWC